MHGTHCTPRNDVEHAEAGILQVFCHRRQVLACGSRAGHHLAQRTKNGVHSYYSNTRLLVLLDLNSLRIRLVTRNSRSAPWPAAAHWTAGRPVGRSRRHLARRRRCRASATRASGTFAKFRAFNTRLRFSTQASGHMAEFCDP